MKGLDQRMVWYELVFNPRYLHDDCDEDKSRVIKDLIREISELISLGIYAFQLFVSDMATHIDLYSKGH